MSRKYPNFPGAQKVRIYGAGLTRFCFSVLRRPHLRLLALTVMSLISFAVIVPSEEPSPQPCVSVPCLHSSTPPCPIQPGSRSFTPLLPHCLCLRLCPRSLLRPCPSPSCARAPVPLAPVSPVPLPPVSQSLFRPCPSPSALVSVTPRASACSTLVPFCLCH